MGCLRLPQLVEAADAAIRQNSDSPTRREFDTGCEPWIAQEGLS